MKIFALEKKVTGVKDEDFTPLLKQKEAAKVWKLYQEGTIRELYFRQDWPGAVLVLECADSTDAERVLGKLPLVEAGLIAFDLIPLIPYPGFSRLFGEEVELTLKEILC
jgi:hypothetical protein